MTDNQLIRYAVEEGFAAAAVIDTDKIPFDPSFRPYCEENLCGQYGVNYACPGQSRPQRRGAAAGKAPAKRRL